ncbi:MAG: hypothetical protein AAGD25_15815 [Cyanobacteria bacterium P01_F01_bin.150]
MPHRLSDEELINQFIQESLQNQEVLLANANLTAQATHRPDHTIQNQLLSKQKGIVAYSTLNHQYPEILVRNGSNFWVTLNYALARRHFIPIKQTEQAQFSSYQYVKIPEGYQMACTKAMELWRTWWKYYRRARYGSRLAMNLLVRVRQTWYPVQNLEVSNGLLFIRTLVDETTLHGTDLIFWLEKDT